MEEKAHAVFSSIINSFPSVKKTLFDFLQVGPPDHL